MARMFFTQELQKLQDELLLMGSHVIQAIREAVAALQQGDLEAARRLIAGDREINRQKYHIEERCLTLIATQQPMARDLRLLAAILEISTELERMGDYAKGISKIVLFLNGRPTLEVRPEFQEMCEKVLEMLQRALDAFVGQDLEAAQTIPQDDDEVDACYNRLNRWLIDTILAHPERIDQANYLSWAAHNLERAGDRVTNICERTIYTLTGEFVEFDAEEPAFNGRS
ncbi:phosphate signaling complex protein PhoU [Litorilinea aerophila]|uniref:Phosphate-specific transport system accessory protein PhoU n=1 Tax=Litorilinea aerophila TaxID=1204385 RepID=A0A540VC52_9CHLR|nr:phosphate signaling complex protein PhoU [Litorilinea aerophila]MCC9077861.1 phosphate signaling complex protein PhoU [Litorilinea aerophila]OUC08669.1 hypothetical protein RY27_07625 [Litorilinea aerophila]